jgi:hypothetical protein
MFLQNRKRPISVEFRGCFHDTEKKQVHTKKTNKIEYLKTVDSQRAFVLFDSQKCELLV